MKIIQTLNIIATLSLFAFTLPAFSDEVINDDLIVTGDTCVGLGCADGEEFGFLGLKIKSEEPRILFDDTSTSTFPTNNWVIGITDNGLHDTADFIISDSDAGSNVLVLQPGAEGGVSLGSDSALVANAVSVGATGMERRIVHVAEGVDDTDAVNKAQLLSELSNLSSSVDERIDAIDARINDLLARINNL